MCLNSIYNLIWFIILFEFNENKINFTNSYWNITKEVFLTSGKFLVQQNSILVI